MIGGWGQGGGMKKHQEKYASKAHEKSALRQSHHISLPALRVNLCRTKFDEEADFEVRLAAARQKAC